jgi:2-keto-4-pentenoate hydratase
MKLVHSLHVDEEIAGELVRARLSGQGIPGTPQVVPTNTISAMRVQALVQKQLALPVLGWKVAIGPEKMPVAAPLLEMDQDESEMRLFYGCAIEVELAVRLSKGLPKRKVGAYQRSEIIEAIEGVFLGIEVIGGRFTSTASVPFLSFLADNLGNRTYVVGQGLPLSVLEQVSGLTCHVVIDGLSLYQSPASHPAGDPLLPLLAYANQQNDDLGGLNAGQFVTTGTLCGVLPVQSAGLLKAHLGNIGQVSILFTV